MISMQTRKPIDLLAINGGDIVNYVCDEPCPIEKPSRIKVMATEPVASLTAKYSDYIEHILDLFPLEKYRTQRIRRFEMAYVAESYYGDTLSFFLDDDGKDVYGVEVKKNGDETVCRAKVIFE